MENYRIVERQYPESGDTVYVVERTFDDSEWNSVFRSADLETAKGVYKERVNRTNFTQRVIEV
jgi:hypothetical protein